MFDTYANHRRRGPLNRRSGVQYAAACPTGTEAFVASRGACGATGGNAGVTVEHAAATGRNAGGPSV